MGTKGEIRAAIKQDSPITVYDFSGKETEEISVSGSDGVTDGHGGGDEGIVSTLREYQIGIYKGKSVFDISISCENHLIVFAAEKLRIEGTVVDTDEYVKEIDN